MTMIDTDLVKLDLDAAAATKDEAINALVEVVLAAGRASDAALLRSDLLAREQLMPTGIAGGIGIPHARSAAVSQPTVAFGRSTKGIDFGASDGPAHLVFMILVPAGAGSEHLKILASLSRSLVRAEFRDALINAVDEQTVVDTALAAQPVPQPASTPTTTTLPGTKRKLRFVGVTSCPTGIAHTYMAAEALESAAKDAGHETAIETQGSGASRH